MMGDLDLAEKMVKELFSLTTDELREKMRALGITGRTVDANECVVAQYLSQQAGVDSAVGPTGVTIIGDRATPHSPYMLRNSRDLNSGGRDSDFGKFIHNFDQGDYKELLVDEEE